MLPSYSIDILKLVKNIRQCSGRIKGSFISCKHGSTLILSKKQGIYQKKRITQGWFDRCDNNEQ